MSEKMFKAGQSFTRAYKKFDDFANKGLITSLKERFKKKKTPVLSKSKELVKFDSAKALPSKLSSVTKKAGKFGKLKAVGRVASRVALPLTLGIEGANLAYKVATLSPEKKAKVKKLKKTLSKKSTKQSHADLLKMNTGGDTMGLKPIPEEKEKSLGKLPEKVRNKMGFEKDGGIMKARYGTMAKGDVKEGLKKSNAFKSKLETFRKNSIKKLRGAQVGPAEEAKLNSMMPNIKDSPDTMKAKKEAIKTKLSKLNKAKSGKMMKAKSGKMIKAYKGDMAKGYGAARTQGEGLQDENLIPGKSLDYHKDIL